MRKLLIVSLLVASLFSFAPPQISWTAIGDSITYLNDHADETGNRVTKGYLTRVVEKMPEIHYINQGHNGWMSSGIAEKIDQLGLQPSDLYTVFLGTNDWWHGRPIGDPSDY
ncbi:MAG: SGNH/GDSL hydrolase family protein, partial [Marinilabiliales bacterium]|nr:SGNH/GDSL hydrolase family protein [Marinilabiliales bacterium]